MTVRRAGRPRSAASGILANRARAAYPRRVPDGLPPACVQACPQKAMVFGDLKDPTSEIRRRLAERPALRRRPGLGTEPQVYYLL